jgi:hypothetical protein
MNKFQARLKPSPLLCIPDSVTAMNGLTTTIPFHYLNQEDYESNRNQGIASEFEHHLNITTETLRKLRDPLMYSGCTGKMRDYNRFVVQENLKKKRPFYEKDFGHPGDEDTMQANKSLLKDIYLNVIQPNNSSVIAECPSIDKTINDGTGGPEILFSPVTLAALPLLKIELARVMHYAHQFGIKKVPDSSIHFHASADMFGGTPQEFQETLENLIWFFIENPVFMQEFSGRIDDGADLASIRYMLGDPLGELSGTAFKRKFYQSKGAGLRLLIEQGCIKRDDKMQLGSAKLDDRIKGFFNLIIKDKYDTVEYRWPASTEDVEEYMAQYEFFFALINFCKIQGIHGTEELDSLKSIVGYIGLRKDKYPHLWNKILLDRHASVFIEQENKVAATVIDFNSTELFPSVDNFSIYETDLVKKYFTPVSLESDSAGGKDTNSRAELLYAEIKPAEAVNIEIPPLVKEIEKLIEVPVSKKYKCTITGKETDNLWEMVETISGHMIDREHYFEEDLNQEETPDQLRCEHCRKCDDEIAADEDDGTPNSEDIDDMPYCYECYCNALDEDIEEDEEEEELSILMT